MDLTEKKEFTYFYACSSPKLDSINSSFRIYPIFSYDEEERESSTTYYVNDDKLIVYTRRYSKSSGDFMGVNIYFYERIE